MAKKKLNRGGRPRKDPAEKLVRVHGCIAPLIYQKLMEIAEREDLDQSGVIRAACEQYVNTRTLNWSRAASA